MRLTALLAATALSAMVLLACGGSDPAPARPRPPSPRLPSGPRPLTPPRTPRSRSTPKAYFIHTEW